MEWDRDPLWAKAKLFLDDALHTDRDDPRFGLWCAFSLELLARAAVASVSPMLLAEQDEFQRNMLYVVGRGNPKSGPRSISAAKVFKLCESLFDSFTAEHTTAATALLNRRNAEVHTGQAAFQDYTTQKWLTGFYSCCSVLVVTLGESLSSFMGDDEAAEARRVLEAAGKEVRQRVKERISRHRAVFLARDESARSEAQEAAATAAERLARHQHHRAECPSCCSIALVQGDLLGESKVEHGDGEIVVKQAVGPRTLICHACGLKLEGYGELVAADLGDHYTRTTRYLPEEYYELINPENHDEISRIARDVLGFYQPEEEFDNE